MNQIINDFTISVATVNGSGSQSSNTILLKTIFRMGVPVGGKNLFPSNIAGLPTWFSIRVSEKGYIGRNPNTEIIVAMNMDTILKDITNVSPNGIFIFDADLKFDKTKLRTDITNIEIPFKNITRELTEAPKLRKFLANMIYVGVLCDLLDLDLKEIESSTRDQFMGKSESIILQNIKAIEAGIKFSKENIKIEKKFTVVKSNKTQGKIIIDGNTAGAIGSVYGGCSFVAWYPITPSSSLAENFSKYANLYRKTKDGKNTFAILQAEDELSAIGMVLGAGWTGTRAMTTTSGPGISLMSEFAGYAYFTEIPSVIWNVQRVGPSTGLPTRTSQGDISAVKNLSHGDTNHIMLFPSKPEECFEFGRSAFEIAEKIQTLVFVMSDLDLGMNLWMSEKFEFNSKDFDRGKILGEKELNSRPDYQRYNDVDNDGIPYRTVPGTQHRLAPYFTRGSGHNEKAQYTEDNEAYKKLMLRLKKKFETALDYLPKPIIDEVSGAKIGIIAYGSSDIVMKESRDYLNSKNIKTSYLRIKSYPLHDEVKEFIKRHDQIFVVEQNRDSQMKDIIIQNYSELANKIFSITHFDGLPIFSDVITQEISQKFLKSKTQGDLHAN